MLHSLKIKDALAYGAARKVQFLRNCKCAKSIVNPCSYSHLGARNRLLESIVVKKIHWVLLIKQQSQHWPNRGGSQAIKIKEFNVRSKYYKTGLILTFGLSELFLGEPLCANPLGFADKTTIATLAQSGRFVSDQNDQNGGIQGAQKAL